MNPLSCSTEDAWEHGNSLINYMKMVEIEGLTGRIKFDQDGQRSDFQLEIVELKKHGLDKVLFFPQIIYYLKKQIFDSGRSLEWYHWSKLQQELHWNLFRNSGEFAEQNSCSYNNHGRSICLCLLTAIWTFSLVWLFIIYLRNMIRNGTFIESKLIVNKKDFLCLWIDYHWLVWMNINIFSLPRTACLKSPQRS